MKTTLTKLSMFAAILAILAAQAGAFWQPDYKMHFPQLPDLGPTGLDVALADTPLADDFLCIESGAITGIHVWASWLGDDLPGNSTGNSDAGNTSFTLSIYDDGGPQPGGLLWDGSFGPGDFHVELYSDGPDQAWWNPVTNVGEPAGQGQVYQYNFSIPHADAFEQQRWTTYWLEVAWMPTTDDATLGWKSSFLHWDAPAVYSDGGAWQGLAYPDWHLFEPGPIDLSFVITPEPATISILALGSLTLIARRRAQTERKQQHEGEQA